MGTQPQTVTGAPPRTDPQIYSIAMFSPSAIFFLPGTQGMGVVDSGYSRILIFDPYDQWPDPATAVSPSAKAVFGHTSGVSGINHNDAKSLVSNDGNPQASATTLAGRRNTSGGETRRSGPQAAVIGISELYVADPSTHRGIV